MSRNPYEWTEKEWEAHDAALDRLRRRPADQFARDLDLCGWKIVSQQDPEPGETLDNLRWSMNGSAAASTQTSDGAADQRRQVASG